MKLVDVCDDEESQQYSSTTIALARFLVTLGQRVELMIARTFINET